MKIFLKPDRDQTNYNSYVTDCRGGGGHCRIKAS